MVSPRDVAGPLPRTGSGAPAQAPRRLAGRRRQARAGIRGHRREQAAKSTSRKSGSRWSSTASIAWSTAGRSSSTTRPAPASTSGTGPSGASREPQPPIYAALVNDEVARCRLRRRCCSTNRPSPGSPTKGHPARRPRHRRYQAEDLRNPRNFRTGVAVITHWRERLHAVARGNQGGTRGRHVRRRKGPAILRGPALLRLPERRRLLAGKLA